jgi:carboxypeptidase T
METGVVTDNWVVTGNWDHTNTQAFNGSRSLTESPAGLYGQNRNDIIRYNGTFNLSDATAAYLSFWVRHRAENFRDKLQVQVSNNGTSWTAVAGRTTIQETGTTDGSTINGQPSLTGIREEWTQEVFNLSGFLGQPNVRFRFVFTSDANTTGYDFQVDEGFNIDDVKLIKSTTALMTLPVRFLTFTGELLPDQKIRLNWETEVDIEMARFSVLESQDGLNFTELGNVSAATFDLIDHSINKGNNFYRIRAIDKNGRPTNSNIINVMNKQEPVSMIIFPNPVKNELKIRLSVADPGKVTLRVTDILGNTVYTGDVYADESNREFAINASEWPSRAYFIKVVNQSNQVTAVEKFIKQ